MYELRCGRGPAEAPTIEKKSSRPGWIFQNQELCHSVQDKLRLAQAEIDSLSRARQDVKQRCEVLSRNCEDLLREQSILEEYTNGVSSRLDRFDRVQTVSRILDSIGGISGGGGGIFDRHQQDAVISDAEQVAQALDHVDEGIGFLDRHPDYQEARAYLSQFENLRARACNTLKAVLKRSMDRTMEQVLEQVEKKSAEGYETSVFYVRFRASALTAKPLTTLLEKRTHVSELYAGRTRIRGGSSIISYVQFTISSLAVFSCDF